MPNRYGQDRGPTYENDDAYYHRNYTISGVELEHDDWKHGFDSVKGEKFKNSSWSLDREHRTHDLNDRIRGIRGTKRDHYGKGPKNWKRNDDRIREDVCEALYQDYFVDASEIEVDAKDGCVSLTGRVETREEKREAERCIEWIPGIIDIINEIRVTRPEVRRGLMEHEGKTASLS